MADTVKFQNIEPTYDVVILGAGAAGIAAARTLIEQGHEKEKILIVEGRDRIGGRTFTHPEFGDLGAAWFHRPNPQLSLSEHEANELKSIEEHFITLAQKSGLTLSTDYQNSKIYYNGEEVPRERYLGALSKMTELLKYILEKEGHRPTPTAEPDMTASAAIAALKKDEKTKVTMADGFMEWMIRMEYGWASSGRDIEAVSVQAGLKHLSCASGILIGEGMGNFIKELGQPIEERTALNTTVKSIKSGRTQQEIIVADSNGNPKTIHAKCVLCTIPPAVLSHKGDNHEIITNFPDWKKDAIKKLPSGFMNKVIFKFKPGVLEKKYGIGINQHFEVLREGAGNMFFLARPAGERSLGSDLLVGFVGGEQSKKLEAKDDDAAKAYMRDYLLQIPAFKKHGITEDDISKTHYTRWHSDPFARGAYSTPVLNAGNAREKMFEPICDRIGKKPVGKIFFAGEACAHDGWQTHVYGAYKTGVMAAQNILSTLQQQDIGHTDTIAGQPRNGWQKK